MNPSWRTIMVACKIQGYVCWGTSRRRKDVIIGWSISCTWAIGGSSPPPLSLECGLPLLSPFPEAAARTQPWDNDVVMRLSGWYTWLNPVKTSIETFKIWQWDLLISLLPKTSLIYKFLLFLKPVTYPGVAACFFRLLLPSEYWGQFQITPEKLQRSLQNNRVWAVFFEYALWPLYIHESERGSGRLQNLIW